MNSKHKKLIGGTIGFLLLAFSFWYFFNIVAYILIATVLSLMAQPLVSFLDSLQIGKIKFPHLLAVIIGMLSIVLGFSLLFVIIIPLVTEQLNSLSTISMTTLEKDLGEYIIYIEFLLKDYGLVSEEMDLKSMLLHEVSQFFVNIKISSFISNIFDFIVSMFIGVFAVLFITFFFLRDNQIVYKALFLIIPEKYHLETQRILSSTKNLLSRYFVGLIIEVILVGGLEALILFALGVENAFLIGFIGGLLNVIPYLGPVLGMLVGILLGVTSGLPLDVHFELVPLLFKIIGTFLAVNMLDNFVFQPFIYSNSVKAHPLEIFIVIVIGGSVAGIIGMMIAIPTYTFIRIVASEFFINNRIVKRLTASLKEEGHKHE
ncbi:MAG: AI-2E family transporter [Bacteroidales bacterium]|nr:AI-2E family transporter [Bacteroidales bacterium]MDY0216974.1 AI-2E family transporter [Bacteroidales bacterium]